MKLILKAFVRPHVRTQNGKKIHVKGYQNSKPQAAPHQDTPKGNQQPWVGVDLDKTLAHHEPGSGLGDIGHPIPAMMARVRRWLKEGKCIKIFTARASDPRQIPLIHDWLVKHGLPKLEVTNIKDPLCEAIIDDKAKQVVPNTGKIVRPTMAKGGLPKFVLKANSKGSTKQVSYEEESESIRKNQGSPEAQRPHKFRRAIWTHKNYHPRCLLCGDEETMSGTCNGLSMRKGLMFLTKSYTLDYKTTYQGIPIAIENRKGSIRHWTDVGTGESGQTVLSFPYGYIPRTMGMDTELNGKREGIDVYLGPDKAAPFVYIITQMRKPDFVAVDEQKVMLGFPDSESAIEGYLANYNDPRFLGGVQKMTVDEFKRELRYRKDSSWPITGGETV